MRTLVGRTSILATLTSIALLLTACAAPATTPTTTSSPKPSATPSASAAPVLPTVAGYPVGEFPAVPLFALPDLSMLDAAQSAVSLDLADKLSQYPGLEVSNAHCDASGSYLSSTSSMVLYGDGSGTFTDPEGTVVNYGDGSGVTSIGGTTIVNYGDGSGTFDNGTTSVVNYGDGSGNYSRPTVDIVIYGDGSGNRTTATSSLINYGDGGGTYTAGDVSIINYGDGSGTYSDKDISIVNYGDGTGLVDGTPIDVEPIADVPPIGSFPPIGAIQPLDACGTVITLSDSVLFDFDKSELRPEASAIVQALAAAMNGAAAPGALVTGHTDSVGENDYNQTLSEARADAVVDALEAAGVTSTLTAEGRGEAEPVAPNEVDGQDYPAGRQLNRRVEIVIPAF